MRFNLLVTGGCGFIGSAFIRHLLRSREDVRIVNLDALTYAANQDALNGFHEHPRYRFVQGNVNQVLLVEQLLLEFEIDVIVHFAAETHVDRSIDSALPFIESNVLGTVALLEVLKRNPHIHFHHVSTDEVYGSLGDGGLFNERSNYRPNSPYSASKAASDHFVRAYAATYNLTVTTSHCSNNYGPFQHAEKFIPKMIERCLEKKVLPIYGNGSNIRDWIYVDDHVEAVWQIIKHSRKGETYTIGGNCELSNLALLHQLIELIAEETGDSQESYHNLIRFVSDRPGHDYRYAIDCTKIHQTLGWQPKINLIDGLRKTIQKTISLKLSQT